MITKIVWFICALAIVPFLAACSGKEVYSDGTGYYVRTSYSGYLEQSRKEEQQREQMQWKERMKDEANRARTLKGELLSNSGPTAVLTQKLIYQGEYGTETPLGDVKQLVEQEGADPQHCLKTPGDCGPFQGPVVVAARYLRSEALEYLLKSAPMRAQPALHAGVYYTPVDPTPEIQQKVERMVMICVESGAVVDPEKLYMLEQRKYSGVRGSLMEKGIVVQPYLLIPFESTQLPIATAGRQYTALLKAGGGDGHGYEWSSDSLPEGLTLGSKAGKISGTPVRAGRYNFAVKVTSHDGQSAGSQINLQIVPAGESASFYKDLDAANSDRLKKILVARHLEVPESSMIIDGKLTAEATGIVAHMFATNPMVYAQFYDSIDPVIRTSLPKPGDVASRSTGAARELFLAKGIPVEELMKWAE